MSTLKWWEKIFVVLAGLGTIATPVVLAVLPVAAPAVNEGMQQVGRVVDAIPKACADVGRAAECDAFEARDVYESNGSDGGLVSCRCPAVAR